MPLWRPNPVSSEPVTSLVRWRAFMTMQDPVTYHLMGVTDYGEARVSSPLASFDKETRTATSRSSRKYILVGPFAEEMTGDVQYVFQNWLRLNNLTDAEVSLVLERELADAFA